MGIHRAPGHCAGKEIIGNYWLIGLIRASRYLNLVHRLTGIVPENAQVDEYLPDRVSNPTPPEHISIVVGVVELGLARTAYRFWCQNTSN